MDRKKLKTSSEESTRRIREKLSREMGSVLNLLRDPRVIEIILNSDGEVWVERLGETMEFFENMPRSQADSLLRTVASSVEVILNDSSPILECEFPLDGSRFEALVPPIVSAPIFSIRKKASQVFTLDDYAKQGIMTDAQQMAIEAAVDERKNILIVGGTGSGKTTLTNAVIHDMAESCPNDRMIILEDTCELQCAKKNTEFLRSNVKTSMTDLLKATLRLRPDRIHVGEVRDGAALALLKAWNTGHPGGVATIHANSAHAGLIRLEQLISEVTQSPMASLIGEAVNMVVYIEKHKGGRRIREVMYVKGHNGNRYKCESLGGSDA